MKLAGLVSVLCPYHTGISSWISCSVVCLLLWTVVTPSSSLGGTQVRMVSESVSCMSTHAFVHRYVLFSWVISAGCASDCGLYLALLFLLDH